MRYLVQFLIPAAIVAVVVYLLIRNRTRSDSEAEDSSDTGTFMLIIIIGATVAIASFVMLQAFWE
ncbi:MAG: hypothetical protein O6766_12075 [Gammaproteobacteria bacterium]|jgi:TRAP-type mannitol/chloroaromatic compound transport system permease small subunit|nr:hypothetical protein [Gammaproteobacteria bacterium]